MPSLAATTCASRDRLRQIPRSGGRRFPVHHDEIHPAGVDVPCELRRCGRDEPGALARPFCSVTRHHRCRSAESPAVREHRADDRRAPGSQGGGAGSGDLCGAGEGAGASRAIVRDAGSLGPYEQQPLTPSCGGAPTLRRRPTAPFFDHSRRESIANHRKTSRRHGSRLLR
jgi:hypothetical protein